jgi:murein DD-endopeptidase MepM/ murein hydrolase activator NlpD
MTLSEAKQIVYFQYRYLFSREPESEVTINQWADFIMKHSVIEFLKAITTSEEYNRIKSQVLGFFVGENISEEEKHFYLYDEAKGIRRSVNEILADRGIITFTPKYRSPFDKDFNFIQDFGFRNEGETSYTFNFHNGVDLSAGANSKIYCISTGTLVFSGGTSGSGGNQVIIEHLDGSVATYSHLRELVSIPIGSVVSQGKVIGTEGNSGYEKEDERTHLHLSIAKTSDMKSVGYGREAYISQFLNPKTLIKELKTKEPQYKTRSI